MAKIQKLVEIGKTRTGCTGTTLTCTGTSWPKMTRMQNVPVQVQLVPVQVQLVPVQVSEKCPECVFFPLLMPIHSIQLL